MGIGKVLYNLTGITTKKYQVELCTNFGKKLTNKIREGQKVTTEDVSGFLKENLSKKNFNNVTVTGNPEVSIKFLIDSGISPALAEKAATTGHGGFFIGQNGKHLLCFRTNEISDSKQAGLVSHELEHLFSSKTSLLAKVGQITNKIFPQYIKKMNNKYSNLLQEKYTDLYFKSLKMVNRGNLGTEKEIQEELRKCIREDILLPNCDKKNTRLLQMMRDKFLDEERAYHVQYEVQKVPKARDLSKVMNSASKVLKEEISNQRWNKFRQFFGLKPKEYKIEKTKTVDPEILKASAGREITLPRAEVIKMYKSVCTEADKEELMASYKFTEEELK